MALFERVKKLSDDQGKSLKTVATDLGFGENSLYGWKKKNPGIDKLQAVADYFHVSTDYLLGRTDTPSFTEADEKDIQKTVNDMINGLSNKNALAFMKNGGEELDEDEAELLRASLETVARQSLLLSRQRAKKNNE